MQPLQPNFLISSIGNSPNVLLRHDPLGALLRPPPHLPPGALAPPIASRLRPAIRLGRHQKRLPPLLAGAERLHRDERRLHGGADRAGEVGLVFRLGADERQRGGLGARLQAVCHVGEAGCLRQVHKGGSVKKSPQRNFGGLFGPAGAECIVMVGDN